MFGEIVAELEKLREDLNVRWSVLGKPFGCGACGIAHMRRRVREWGGCIHKTFIYRLEKGKRDIDSIRGEFERLTEQHEGIGKRTDVFQKLYIDEFGYRPYGFPGRKPELLKRCEYLRGCLGLKMPEFSLAIGMTKTRYYHSVNDMKYGMSAVSAFVIEEVIKEAEKKHGIKYAGEQS